jgi:hypothetical protein
VAGKKLLINKHYNRSDGKCSAVFHKQGKRVMIKHGVETSKEFELDGAFNTKHTQDVVFESMGPTIASTLMRGYNCTLVCDGFPKTGKTVCLILLPFHMYSTQ